MAPIIAAHLRAIGRWCRQCLRSPQGALGLAAIVLTLAGGVMMAVWMGSHGLAISRLEHAPPLDTVFFTRDGRPWFRLEENNRSFPLRAISPRIRDAVVAVEDHRFRYHPGVDPVALARAGFRNLTSGRVVEGGSTISQQLARTLFLSNRRTLGRKLREFVLAVMLEQQLSKDEILELYLNRIYLGSDTYGVGMLAERLFGKTPENVTLAEAALMAGTIRAPSALSPWTNPTAALSRKDVVLARMRDEGFITAGEERNAREAALHIRRTRAVRHAGTGYLQEHVRQQFLKEFGPDLPSGWLVLTTALPEVQQLAEQAVARGLRSFNIPDLQAALVAIDPRSGGVLAMVGGGDFTASPFNRATQANRQVGSAFKPFAYAAALERGLTPVSMLSGLATMPAVGRDEWRPANADGSIADSLPLRAALVESNNLAAVKLQKTVGSGPVLALARDVGLRDLPDVPSLALGTGASTPLALASAYAVFPSGGTFVKPRVLRQVRDQRRSIVWDERPEPEPALSPQSAFQMVSLLQDVLDRGTGAGARAMGVRFPAGGKTGTTDDYRDAWFAGFSASVVAVVWVGFDSPRPIAEDAYAARFALPIWSDFMRDAASILPPRPFAEPRGLRHERICRVSFLKAGNRCPAYDEVFKEDDELPGSCALHGSAPVQAAGRWERFLAATFGWLRPGAAEPDTRVRPPEKRRRAPGRHRGRDSDRDSDSDSR